MATKSLIIKISADYLAFMRQSKKFSGELDKFGSKCTKIGGAMSAALTAPLIAAAAASVNQSMVFSKSMAEVSTLCSNVATNIAEYQKQVINLTKEISVSADEAAKALYQIVSAGHSGANGMKVLEVAAKSAVAGVTTTAIAADAITTALNAYSLSADDAEKVSDMFFMTVKKGKTTMAELGQNFAKVAPIASAFSIEMEEVLAMVATLTKSGTPTAEAMTQIRAAIISTSKVLGDGYYKTHSLQQGLAEIARQANGSESELRKLIPEIEAMSAVLGATGLKAQVAASDLDAMKSSAGEMNKAYNIMADELSSKVDLLKNSFTALSIELGTALTPIVETLTDSVQDLADWFGDLNDESKQTVLTMGVIAVAIGPVLLALGSIIKVVVKLKSAFIVVKGAIVVIGTAIVGTVVAIGAAFLAIEPILERISANIAKKAKELKNTKVSQMAGAYSTEYLQDGIGNNETEIKKLLIQEEELVSRGVDSAKDEVRVVQIRKEIQALKDRNTILKEAILLKSELDSTKTESFENNSDDDLEREHKRMVEMIDHLNKQKKELSSPDKSFLPSSQLEITNINIKLDLLTKEKKILEEVLKVKKEIAQEDGKSTEAISLRSQQNELSTPIAEGIALSPISLPVLLVDTDKLNDNVDNTINAVDEAYNNLRVGLMQLTSQFATDSLITIFEGFGEMMAGGGFEGALTSIASLFTNFMGSVGKMLIQYGVQMLMMQEAVVLFMSQMWNPAGAIGLIAVGGVLIATASAMKSSMQDSAPKLANGGLAYGPTYAMVGDNRNAGIDPEVIAPLSKLKSMIGESGGFQNINLSGTFGIRGGDLQLILNKNNVRSKTIRN